MLLCSRACSAYSSYPPRCYPAWAIPSHALRSVLFQDQSAFQAFSRQRSVSQSRLRVCCCASAEEAQRSANDALSPAESKADTQGPHGAVSRFGQLLKRAQKRCRSVDCFIAVPWSLQDVLQVLLLYAIVNYIATKWLAEYALTELEAAMQQDLSVRVQHLCNLLLQAASVPLSCSHGQG